MQSHGLLWGLWSLWAVLLFGGFIAGPTSSDNTRRMPRITRMGASWMLVLAAWIWAWQAHGSAVGTTGWLMAVGMSWGLIGDLCMAHLLPIKQRVLGGIGAFGLGHCAYIAGWLLLQPAHIISMRLWIAWLGWVVAGAAGWYYVVWRGSRQATLHKLALPYAVLLASTTGIATGLALHVPTLWPLAVGAALFLLSDLFLAAQLFNQAFFPLISDVVWLLYSPGQMLIVYGMGTILTSAAQGALI